MQLFLAAEPKEEIVRILHNLEDDNYLLYRQAFGLKGTVVNPTWLGFPITIPLRAIALNCAQLFSNCAPLCVSIKSVYND